VPLARRIAFPPVIFRVEFRSRRAIAFRATCLLLVGVADPHPCSAASAEKNINAAQPVAHGIPGSQLPVGAAVDSATSQILSGHHPLWANPGNDAGTLTPNQTLDPLTIVRSRSPQQEQAFEQLLADQENPASPEYHHWLTPVEVGERFGPSDQDVDSVTGYLESQGLHVNWVSPSRIFIGFRGTAEQAGRAFHTEFHSYRVNGAERMSVSSDPMIPEALAAVIKAIHGLYTIEDNPTFHVSKP
jgi:hypothetical protein